MRVKLISAPNMAEAMRRVRTELGEEALILGHRRVADGVEITAALEPEAAAPEPTPRQSSLERRLGGMRFGALDWAKPIMLVGTPGAGKTLTAAKLATRLVQKGEHPIVITAAAQRAGAAEQLAAFTLILDINLIIAENPLTMARALAGQGARKSIIDMAVFNPFEAEQR